MKIATLIIMQEELSEVGHRFVLGRTHQFCEMVEFVKDGGFFTKTALEKYVNDELRKFTKVRLISITEFEDGTFFIHDGHHRIGSILRAGRDYLREDEYTITKMRHTQYDEINPNVNFVTPFVPLREVRLSDFAYFKNTAIRLFRLGKPHDAVFYIRNNRKLYCKPRTILYVKDFIKGVSCSL